MEKFWKVINSQLFLLMFGFLLTGVIGHLLTARYQATTWERDRKYEVFKQEIEEAKRTLESVNLHISDRTFSLQKVHWELEARDIQGANQTYAEYAIVKDTWNKKVRIYRNKLKRLVDEDLAYLLLDSENAVNIPQKESVHAFFANAHNKTRAWKSCVERNCEKYDELQAEAHAALKKLFQSTDSFIDVSYSIFLEKYKQLQPAQ